ncbi:MAG: hypothetical protein M1825_002814 [Sarcosagium campestre]|nr:MAG: hypothetical protein M1825_002814 [Sarcosagium campestre]
MSSAPPAQVPIPKRGVDYRNKVVLAPMVRSGELPTRLLALKYGADLVWGPETIDQALIGTTRRINPHNGSAEFSRLPSNGSRKPTSEQKESIIYRLHPERERGRLIFQMGTSNPARAVQAAKLVAADVAGIDVNAGCPKPFSTLGGMGAALLETPDKLCAILSALVEQVGTPYEIGISVKIRILKEAERTERLVRQLCATGIIGLTVHCRTTPMRPRERAIRDQLRMIAGVCRESGVACIMNGDVESREHALALMTEFGVDGAMLATSAESNPSCFRLSKDGGLAPWRQLVDEYLHIALGVDNKWANAKFMLINFIPGKDPVHIQIHKSKCYTTACRYLGLADLHERALEVDERLGLGEHALADVRDAELSAAGIARDLEDVASRFDSLSVRQGNDIPADSSHLSASQGILMGA